jgi:glycosyltransferase involved in cell wall biosynthesis
VEYHNFVAGGQVVLLNHFQRLDRKRYLPLLAVSGEGPFSREARKLGVKTFVVPMGKARWRRPWQAWPAMKALQALMTGERADLVLANCYPANKLAGPAAKGAGLPCIWYKHILAKKRYSTTGMLWRFFSRFNQRILTPSFAVKKSLMEMGIPEAKLASIYHGVDLEALRRAKPKDSEALKRAGFPLGKGPVIGVVAMHRTHKGIDLFLRACQQVAAQAPRVSFVVIGDPQNAEESMEALIQALASSPELEGRVSLLPGQRDVASWMKHMDILVSPSRWEVGAPLVPMEAMALGIPVLATDLSSGELIQDGKDGLLVKAGDVDALAKGMLRLIRDKVLAKRLGLAGKKTVEARHRLSHYSAQLMDFYDEVIEDFAGGQA